MKFKLMLSTILFSVLLSLTACSIEGEDLCGIWYAQGDYGQMKVEITPWKGAFLGYLLEYNSATEEIKGAKTEDFIFLTDLVFEGGIYQKGKIYLDPNSKESCGISLRFLNENELEATYLCGGETIKEVWSKNAYSKERKEVAPTNKTEIAKAVPTNAAPSEKSAEVSSVSSPSQSPQATQSQEAAKTKPAITPTETPPVAKTKDEATKQQATFYVIGIKKLVDYNDIAATSKASEALWNQIYKEDFSQKLSNIKEFEKMYVVYSDYDQPKGKMTMTIGYRVADLSNIPSGLFGVKVPSNSYYVYPLSGNESDYEGEGWEQLAEMMAYRKAESVDFEVYSFDSNYEVTQASIWIAAK